MGPKTPATGGFFKISGPKLRLIVNSIAQKAWQTMSFGVKLILNIKKHHNLTILPKKSINFCKTQHISKKKTQANTKKLKQILKKLKQIPKKLKQIPKKLNVPEENAYPLLQKSVKKKSL